MTVNIEDAVTDWMRSAVEPPMTGTQLDVGAVRASVARRARRRRIAVVASKAGVIVACVAVGLSVLVTSRSATDAHITRPASNVPVGREVVLAERDPWLPPDRLMRPGSTGTFTVDGRFTIDVWTGMSATGGDVVHDRCISATVTGAGSRPGMNGGPTSCDQYQHIPPQNVTRASVTDPGRQTVNLWLWSGLPASVAYVEFQDGDRSYWQRPLHGVVVFPTVDRLGHAGGISYDAAGSEIDRVSATDPLPSATAELYVIPAWGQITVAQRGQAHDYSRVVFGQCLDRTRPETAESWEACLPEVESKTTQWIAEHAAIHASAAEGSD